MASISSVSLEYVRVPVIAMDGGLAVDPTADPVQMAFLTSATATPAAGDWKTASWDTPVAGSSRYIAQCLVGPGGAVTLTTGTWYVWIKVTDNPEIPVHQSGTITVT